MDPERWQRLNELFHAALERAPDGRAAFLHEACADDPPLQAEVTSLLANHEEAASFIEQPAYEGAAELLDEAPAESLVGRRLGQYLVTRRLGQGGMGVVYEAEDTRLGRRVALKALAPQFTHHDRLRERLRREARMVANLSHPGIATVYALEEFGDQLYIVSEYVEGRTLREELGGGPLPLGPLLTLGVEVASALAAAHERGIVHRDLKPENVIRTADARMKVLDFGLARFHPEGGPVPFQNRLTKAGAVLGTLGYMSPEQLRGVEVDFRTDIFTFGILLYELATAVHPFAAPDPASAIARVLEREPTDLNHLRPAAPPDLNQLIHRCLHKDPEQRPRTARELVVELERITQAAARVEAGPPVPGRATGVDTGRRVTPLGPLWWWRFHQIAVGLGYYVMLYPLWQVRGWTPGILGLLLFFSALMAVGVAGNLRLHLWFTSRFYPAELAAQRARVARWIRWSDAIVALLLSGSAAVIARSHTDTATLLVAVAVASVVGFLIVEPATARAAFADDSLRGRRDRGRGN